MKIDLHMHTTVSDGTDAPEAIIPKIKAAGIDMFAVTDHDAIKGCSIVKEQLEAGDPFFVSGIEFSCKDQFGKYHILGYGYDSSVAAIGKMVNKSHSLRMEKLGKRLKLLKEKFDISFSEEDLADLYANNNPGKPHIANLMIKYHYAGTKKEAFSDFLNRVDIPDMFILPQEAIEAILLSGGIPILAHPFYGSGDELIVGEEMEKRLERMMDLGIQGVEGFYSGFSPLMLKEILGLAAKYNLYLTAGSDYHGSNKMISLGDNCLHDTDEAPEGLHRFLRDVPRR